MEQEQQYSVFNLERNRCQEGKRGEQFQSGVKSVKVTLKSPTLINMHFPLSNVEDSTPPASALMACHLGNPTTGFNVNLLFFFLLRSTRSSYDRQIQGLFRGGALLQKEVLTAHPISSFKDKKNLILASFSKKQLLNFRVEPILSVTL